MSTRSNTRGLKSLANIPISKRSSHGMWAWTIHPQRARPSAEKEVANQGDGASVLARSEMERQTA
eukprot:2749859-Rhodomonas_salina.1